MSIFDTARSLGEELIHSPEYIALKEAEEPSLPTRWP